MRFDDLHLVVDRQSRVGPELVHDSVKKIACRMMHRVLPHHGEQSLAAKSQPPAGGGLLNL